MDPSTTAASVRYEPQQESQSQDWDNIFLAVMGTQDHQKLRDLLARCDLETIMPFGGNEQSPLSQAVILTLLHRVSAVF